MPPIVKKHPALCLVLTCYAVGLLVFLVVCLVGLVQNRLAYQSGALQTAALTLDDFDLVDLEPQEDGTLLSVGGDPQLRLRDTTRRVENVTVDITYRLTPLLVNAFWGDATTGEAAYSPRRMAYGSQTQGGLRFLLPPAGGQSLRIDPGTVVGNTIAVNRIVINEKRPFYAFFIPTATQGLVLCALPALVACAIGLLPRPRQKAGDGHG